LNNYCERNQQKIKEQIKKNEKDKTYKVRLLREINNGLIMTVSAGNVIPSRKYNIPAPPIFQDQKFQMSRFQPFPWLESAHLEFLVLENGRSGNIIFWRV
jgi:hypothetical protein